MVVKKLPIEELRKQAADLGYKLVKQSQNSGNPRMLPCTCGCNKRSHIYTPSGIVLECKKCKKQSSAGRNNYAAIVKWNAMIINEQEEIKEKRRKRK